MTSRGLVGGCLSAALISAGLASAAASADEAGRDGGSPADAIRLAQAPGARPATELLIVNRSRSRLDTFEIMQDSARAQLPRPLAGGRQTRLALGGFTACAAVYQVTFADFPPISYEIDLCRQSTINLRRE